MTSRLIKKVNEFYFRLLGITIYRVYFAAKKIPWKKGFRIYGLPHIRNNSGTIVIGKNLVMRNLSFDNAVGVFHPTIITLWNRSSQLIIGENAGLSGCTITVLDKVTIGSNVLIGTDAIIVDSDMHPVDSSSRVRKAPPKTSPVVIGDEVFIGMRAMILKGVTVNRGAAVAAGSVVTHDVPINSIVAGNPAKVVKQIS